jgi:hypothetical protein
MLGCFAGENCERFDCITSCRGPRRPETGEGEWTLIERMNPMWLLAADGFSPFKPTIGWYDATAAGET